MTADVDQAQLVPTEDCSTGTAWRAPKLRPEAPLFPPSYRPCTAAEQAEHMAALTDGIAGYAVGRLLRAGEEPR